MNGYLSIFIAIWLAVFAVWALKMTHATRTHTVAPPGMLSMVMR